MNMGTKRRTTKLDMHLHTPTSDGYGKPADYVKAIQKAGIDGIVITDHHVTKDRANPASLEVAKAVREAGFICLHGCEYSSDNGHILIYGVDVAELDLGGYMPMQEVIWRTLDAGGIAIPSHPYHGYRKRLGDDCFKLQDLWAMEGWNGQNQVRHGGVREDEQAQESSEKLGIPVIANSDAHIAYRIGTCYTEFDGLVRRNGDLVEALTDPAVRFRPVVNRRKVAEQRKVGFYSSRSLWTKSSSHLDTGGESPYAQNSYGGGWHKNRIPDADQIRRWEEEDEALARLFIEEEGLEEGLGPEDFDPEDPFGVAETPEAVSRGLAWLDRAKP